MLTACFAEQLWVVRYAFCPDQCCNALNDWVTAHLYDEQIPKCLFAVTQACWQPVLQSEVWAVRNAFCSDQCCSALVMRHCTHVCWRVVQRCNCSDISMLSACFAEQHRAVRSAFCPEQYCSALKLGHCTHVCSAKTQMSICSDTSLLSACFAEQLWAVRNAFCSDQCCSGLNLGTAHLYVEQIPKGLFAVTEICWQPVLQSNSG